MNRKNEAVVFLALSATAAVFTLLIVLLGPSTSTAVEFTDKAIVIGAFVLSSVIGFSLATRPGWIRMAVSGHDRGGRHAGRSIAGRKRLGHHPDCRHFDSHRLVLGGRVVCAGCTGLATGSVIALALAISYLFSSFDVAREVAYVFTALVLIIVAANFAGTSLSWRKTLLHVPLDVTLVIGFFLATVSLLTLTGSPAFGMLGVVFSLLWVDTKIRLSNWRHAEKCSECLEDCKSYQV